MGGWKCKLLSKASRVILLKSVCGAIPAYAMMSCRLPKQTVAQLDKLNRDFLWGDMDGKKSTHPVAWRTVCRPKGQGGLGLRMMSEINTVLMAKLAWRWIQNPTTLWSQLLSTKYGQLGDNNTFARQKSLSVVGGAAKDGLKFLERGLRVETTARGVQHWSWQSLAKGIFTTKSAYELLIDPPTPTVNFPWNRLWKLQDRSEDLCFSGKWHITGLKQRNFYGIETSRTAQYAKYVGEK